jgi:hypothetical protein
MADWLIGFRFGPQTKEFVMRKLTISLMLLLLLSFVFGINAQADETLPPPDPGVEDGGGGDITGDHPWGGDDNVVIVTDPDPEVTFKSTISFSKYIKLFMYNFYGVDLLGSPKQMPTRVSEATRYRSPSQDDFRYSLAKRSR